MLVAAVGCLAAAVVTAAVMLAAAGVVALSAPPKTGLLVVVVCVVGAIATVAAGCWQSAKFVAARESSVGCGGTCATCALSCH